MIDLHQGASDGALVVPGKSGVVVNGMRNLQHLGDNMATDLTVALSRIPCSVACWLEQMK